MALALALARMCIPILHPFTSGAWRVGSRVFTIVKGLAFWICDRGVGPRFSAWGFWIRVWVWGSESRFLA